MEQDTFKDIVSGEITRFVQEDDGNRLGMLDNSPIYQAPLVGFVSGDDPIFMQLKSVIGKFHLTPREALTKCMAIRGLELSGDSPVGVISYILPISQVTRDQNAGMDDRPSERWAHTRLFGQQFNDKLQLHVTEFLEQQGFAACAPELDKGIFKQVTDKTVGWASTWSQRHVAYAAGLGTFGLSDGLITPAGKAHRIGSIVVNQELDSPERPADIHAYCLYFQDGGCMACARRCPSGAITENGHDKNACGEFVFSQVEYIRETYGINMYACGLCQTGVPCERGIPTKKTE
ncbi:MAG TPA: epoxyqueuosine reductase [Candidatus Lokiarchaeia archaeon]|nr:epoxyqueuosine reductase [Candidatus Lokiarchaeia archaeon]